MLLRFLTGDDDQAIIGEYGWARRAVHVRHVLCDGDDLGRLPRLHDARFPDVKTLDTFDFGAVDGVSAQQIADLKKRRVLFVRVEDLVRSLVEAPAKIDAPRVTIAS